MRCWSPAPKMAPVANVLRLALCALLTAATGESPHAFAQAASERPAEAPSAAQPETNNSSKAKSTVAILHIPPKPNDIPYPGQPLTITAALSNTRDTSASMRIAFAKDGRFLELPAKEAYLDRFDRPTYEVTVPAPVAELTYQMFLVQSDGTPLISPRFAVRRTCIPQVELAEGQVSSEVQGMDRLQKLVIESRALENDLAGYQYVLKVLGDLKGVLNE